MWYGVLIGQVERLCVSRECDRVSEHCVPVPAPMQAMGAFGCLGASCKHRHSVASSRVSKPYPNATKSFTNKTRLMRNSVAIRSPSISQLSRLVNRTERAGGGEWNGSERKYWRMY